MTRIMVPHPLHSPSAHHRYGNALSDFRGCSVQDVALTTARLDNEAAALARRFLQRMRPDRHNVLFIWYVRLSGEENGCREAAKIENCCVRLCQAGTKSFAAITQAAPHTSSAGSATAFPFASNTPCRCRCSRHRFGTRAAPIRTAR
jgi:hypothetical protein